MQETPLILVSASANGILGEYAHSFSIGPSDEFVILYGPNGVGKTKFLEIIDALTRLRATDLERLPFDSVRLTYSDGSELAAERRACENDPLETSVLFTLSRPGESPVAWETSSAALRRYIRQRTRYEQVHEDLWLDPSDGELIPYEDLRAMYEERWRTSSHRPETAPADLEDFVKQVPSFLIETQRLQTEDLRTSEQPRWRPRNREQRQARPRILEQAGQISSLLNDAQTEHSRIAQRLDRSFPNRVLRAVQRGEPRDASAIREEYDQQNEFRSRLGAVASVSLDQELALPAEGDLAPWALALLDLYLEDTKAKLKPFDELLEKIELLEHLINARLLNKRLSITDKEGLAVFHDSSERPIRLESLSSGEQHEIILMIDLLFHVPKGAVVLIDEPEISLHIAWQLAFIPDVKSIAKLVGFRFVVATHSPQIINDEWDRATRLGPKEADF